MQYLTIHIPFFKPTIDWKLEDPKGKTIEKVREIRDGIEERIKELIEKSRVFGDPRVIFTFALLFEKPQN